MKNFPSNLERVAALLCEIQGDSKKRQKVYGTIILQPYVTQSCNF